MLNMRAMILAAGLGTRLLPLTNSRPKALVGLRGVTLLEFWIDRLKRCGFSEVILNAYHLKDRIARSSVGKAVADTGKSAE